MYKILYYMRAGVHYMTCDMWVGVMYYEIIYVCKGVLCDLIYVGEGCTILHTMWVKGCTI